MGRRLAPDPSLRRTAPSLRKTERLVRRRPPVPNAVLVAAPVRVLQDGAPLTRVPARTEVQTGVQGKQVTPALAGPHLDEVGRRRRPAITVAHGRRVRGKTRQQTSSVAPAATPNGATPEGPTRVRTVKTAGHDHRPRVGPLSGLLLARGASATRSLRGHPGRAPGDRPTGQGLPAATLRGQTPVRDPATTVLARFATPVPAGVGLRDPLSRGPDRSTHFDRDDRSPRVDRYARDDRSARDEASDTSPGNQYSEDRRRPSYERGAGTYQAREARPFPRENANRRTGTDGSGREPSSPTRGGQRQAGRGSSFAPEGRWQRGGSGDYGAARDRGFGRSGAGNYRREGAQARRPRPAPPGRSKELPASWGSVTRHGARSLSYDGPSASEIWTRARESAQPGRGRNGEGKTGERSSDFAGGHDRLQAPRPKPDEWEIALVETLPAPSRRDESKPTGRRAHATPRRDAPGTARTPRTARPAPNRASSPAFGSRDEPGQAGNAKLEDATRAYSADRYQDALRMLRKVSAQAPNSAAVRELLGLTLYRLGRWPLAVRELEAHHGLSGSYDQFPVIADCYRAMGRYGDAATTWEALRQASPSAEVVAEGRLVAAGCLADQGDLRGAVNASRRVAPSLETEGLSPPPVVRTGRSL